MKFVYSVVITALMLAFLHGQCSASMELTVDESVSISLENNLGIQLQKEEVISSEERAKGAKGEFDTILSAGFNTGNSTYSSVLTGVESDTDVTTFSGVIEKKISTGTAFSLQADMNRQGDDPDVYSIDPAYTSTFGLTISQPLLSGRGMDVQTATMEAASRQFEAEEYLLESQGADLAAAVKSAYWELVYAWKDIEVKRLSLKLATKLLEQTRVEIEAGRLASVEIFQPESEVARREELLISGERAIGLAEDGLKKLMNIQDWSQEISPLSHPDMECRDIDPDQVLENAMHNRADLLAAKKQLDAATIIAAQKKNHILPALEVYGATGIGASDDSFSGSYDAISDEQDSYWQVGINFSMPLENRYAKAEYQQAVSGVRKAKLQTELLRQEIHEKVRSAIRDVQLALKAIEATHKTALATAKRLEAEQTKFETGKATTFDVLAAQEAYARTLSDEYWAKIAYAEALAEIDRVQGIVSTSP